MKNFKGFFLGLITGLALAVSSIGFAQNPTQVDPAKAKESCCSMSSCCCSGDSCDMKHEGTTAAGKQGCCCCGTDSCDTNMKEKHKEMQKQKQG